MKKIFCVLFMASAAWRLSAQITVSGSVDMAIIPFQYIGRGDDVPSDEEGWVIGAGIGRVGSGQGPRARLDVRGVKDDTIGFRARIQARTDGIGIEDYLQAWWRPLSWLRIDAGRFLDDTLRGKISDDEKWNAYTVRMYDGDAIFSRFKTHWTGQGGLLAGFTPIPNLYIGTLLYGLDPFSASSSSTSTSALFDAHPDYVSANAEVWQRIQVAAAYTIDGIGMIRAQYFGAKPNVVFKRITDEIMDDSNNLITSYDFYTFSITGPRIEAAFAFTMLDNLIVDVGGKIPLPFKDWMNSPDNIFLKEDEENLELVYKTYKNGFIWQAPYQASIGARYKMGDLTLAIRGDTKFGGSVKGNYQEYYLAPEVNIHFWPSYNFGFAETVVDFGWEYIGPTVDKDHVLIGKGTPLAMNGGNRLGFGVSIQKTIAANCLVKGGLAYKIGGTVNGVQEAAVFTIPLYLELSF